MTSMKNLLKVFLMCFITLFAFAGQIMGQQKTITGRVVDALNEGMPGVNVQVKGTTSGTITNIDGDFSISVPNTKSVLRKSCRSSREHGFFQSGSCFVHYDSWS